MNPRLLYLKNLTQVLQEKVVVLENQLNLLHETSMFTSPSGEVVDFDTTAGGHVYKPNIIADKYAMGVPNQGKPSSRDRTSTTFRGTTVDYDPNDSSWPWNQPGANGLEGDFNQDGIVNGQDLGIVLGQWDLNGPDETWQVPGGGRLLGIVLGQWGQTATNTGGGGGGGAGGGGTETGGGGGGAGGGGTETGGGAGGAGGAGGGGDFDPSNPSWPWISGNGLFGDFNQDGKVDGFDLGIFSGDWAPLFPSSGNWSQSYWYGQIAGAMGNSTGSGGGGGGGGGAGGGGTETGGGAGGGGGGGTETGGGAGGGGGGSEQPHWPWDSAYGGNGIEWDFDQDGTVNGFDLGILLGQWGERGPDGTWPTNISGLQLGTLLGAWPAAQTGGGAGGGDGVGGGSDFGERTYGSPSVNQGNVSYYDKFLFPRKETKSSRTRSRKGK